LEAPWELLLEEQLFVVFEVVVVDSGSFARESVFAGAAVATV